MSLNKKIKVRIKKLIIEIVSLVPLRVYDKMTPCFSWEINNESLKRRLQRFGYKLVKNPEKQYQRIVKRHKFMEISKGYFDYKYFNVCYLNNMIDLILYSLLRGYIPVITINNDSPDDNKWDWYFKKPMEILLGFKENLEGKNVVKCPLEESPLICGYENGFYPYSSNFAIWEHLYKKFVIFNEEIEKYIMNEKQALLKGKTLGMLLRGTDFTTLRPQGHPVQPDVEDVLKQAEKWIEEKEYQYIYVATEEERLFKKVVDRFGKEKVLSNNRTYYDDKYYREKRKYIGEVHFQRENDNFLKGLEYLSSITILSSCAGLVSGNCGGNMYALLKAENYIDIKVFNEGYYS